jgi:hypothetical protein
MFNPTLEESRIIQKRFQDQARDWRRLQACVQRQPFQRTILLKAADLMIQSGTQLKNHLQPA